MTFFGDKRPLRSMFHSSLHHVQSHLGSYFLVYRFQKTWILHLLWRLRILKKRTAKSFFYKTCNGKFWFDKNCLIPSLLCFVITNWFKTIPLPIKCRCIWPLESRLKVEKIIKKNNWPKGSQIFLLITYLSLLSPFF